jgi:hypothetical protein
LFDTGDGSVLEAVVGTVLMQRGVDLTGTEDDTIYVLWIIDGIAVLGVWDNPLEL